MRFLVGYLGRGGRGGGLPGRRGGGLNLPKNIKSHKAKDSTCIIENLSPQKLLQIISLSHMYISTLKRKKFIAHLLHIDATASQICCLN